LPELVRIPRSAKACGTLLELDEIRRRLHLGAPIFEAETTIPVAQIIGTVGRAGDFDGCFRPLTPTLQKRIDDIHRARPRVADEAIDVLRVDRAYFVADGHKRVAIARVTGREFIDARISRLASAFELTPGVEHEAIDRTARELEFREGSGLLEAAPAARFALNDLDGYAELAEAVRAYGFEASQRLGRLLSRAEAAGSWFECVYLPTVHAGRKTRIGELIDGCTDADVFLTLHRQSHSLWGTECEAAEEAVERLISEERSPMRAGVSAIERVLNRARRRPPTLLPEIAAPPKVAER